MGTRNALAKLSRELYPGLEAIDQDVVTLDDDNTFTGVTTINQAIFHQDHAVASGSATGDNAFTGHAGVLTEAAHSGKTVLMSDSGGNATLRIPTPSRAGIAYKLVYNGVADDAHDMVISFPDDACYFQGAVMTQDEDEAGAAQVSTIFANGSSNDVLTLNDPHAYCLEMVSLSTTKMAIWGWVVADDAAAFSDAD